LKRTGKEVKVIEKNWKSPGNELKRIEKNWKSPGKVQEQN
jgi:hypothetical protein